MCLEPTKMQKISNITSQFHPANLRIKIWAKKENAFFIWLRDFKARKRPFVWKYENKIRKNTLRNFNAVLYLIETNSWILEETFRESR